MAIRIAEGDDGEGSPGTIRASSQSLEIGAAGLLIAAFSLPWYQLGGQDVDGVSTGGITMDVLLSWFLIPLGAAAVVVASSRRIRPARSRRGRRDPSSPSARQALGVALRLLTLVVGRLERVPGASGRGPRAVALRREPPRSGAAFATIDLARVALRPSSRRALGEPVDAGGSACSWPGRADRRRSPSAIGAVPDVPAVVVGRALCRSNHAFAGPRAAREVADLAARSPAADAWNKTAPGE